MRIAFDVDDTLIKHNHSGESVPKWETIDVMRYFALNTDAEIIVWSGSGVDYAQRWTEKLGIDHYVDKVIPKGSIVVDIAFDDQVVNLGNANVKIR